MRSKATTFLCIILTLSLTAHPDASLPNNANSNKDQVDINKALRMDRYDEDTTAAAVILSDDGLSYIGFEHPRWGIEVVFERTIIVKILKKDGYEWADIKIPLYVGEKVEEEVTSTKGVTYNLVKGKAEKSKLTKRGIFKEETNAHWKLVKITMPDVKVGSVYELSYKVSSPFIYNLQSWSFQQDIPVDHSKYEVRIPEYLKYNQNMKGYISVTTHETSTISKQLTHVSTTRSGGSFDQTLTSNVNRSTVNYIEYGQTWICEKMPAFEYEPYLTTASNYMTGISFELEQTRFPNAQTRSFTTSWNAINKKLNELDNFGGELKKVGFLSKVIPGLVKDLDGDQAKLSAVYKHVTQKVHWNQDQSLTTSDKLKSTYEKGSGNSADINLLFLAMLREANVKAYPVALSTRSHGKIFPTNPTISSFNYVIVVAMIDGKEMLVDATERQSVPGMVPLRCLNGRGRVIDDEGGRWIEIESQPYQVKTMYEVSIEDGLLSASCKEAYYHQAALHFRSNTDYLNEDGQVYAKHIEEEHGNTSVHNVSIEHGTLVEKPVKVTCDLEIDDILVETGNLAYLNPMMLDQMTKNPLKLPNRQYPVEYGYPIDEFFFLKLELPEKYVAESVPESVKFVLPENSATYLYDIKVSGRLVTLRSHLKINKSVFLPDEYAVLRDFYDRIVSKQAEPLVLKISE